MHAGLSSENSSNGKLLSLEEYNNTYKNNNDYMRRAALFEDINNNYLSSKDKNKRRTGVQFIHQLLESDLNNSHLLFNTALNLLNLIGDKKDGEIRNLSEKASLLLFDGIPNILIPVYINQNLIRTKIIS